MLRFPTKTDILKIHQNQIEKYGGSTGIRDMGLLESALAMPQATFGGQAGIDDALETLAISVAQGEADKAVIATFFRENCVRAGALI